MSTMLRVAFRVLPDGLSFNRRATNGNGQPPGGLDRAFAAAITALADFAGRARAPAARRVCHLAAKGTCTPRGYRSPAMNALLAALLTAPGLALAQDLNVTGGASQSNSTPVSYANATVSGQSGGVPSTYTANAAFAASGNLTLGDTGVFNANATTTIGGDTSLSGGARLNLVSGSFQTNALSLSSLSEVVRGSGSDTLRISRFDVSNAALTLKAGDQVYGEQTNYVTSGAIVTNTGMATINGRLAIYGSSGTTRSTFNSNVPVTFSQGLLSQSGQLNVNANTTFGGNVDIQYDGALLALNSGTLSAPGLGVYYGARAIRSGGFYNVTNFYLDNGATLDYLPGDSITGALYLYNSSTLALGRNLALTGGIDLRNSAALVTGSNTYSAASLNMDGNVALTYKAGDLIASSGNVDLRNGSTLTLQRNLDVSVLNLSGNGALSRSTESLRISRFDVSNAALTLKAGDQVYGEQTNNVASGAIVTNTGMATINGRLAIYGSSGTTRSTFNSNVPVTFSQGLLSQS
ncbi:MAG: hypothetical protein KGQ61_07280, partial [Planctomycetes bacterium]|nr:hypothetical protein [Planctomycetota bacterium]